MVDIPGGHDVRSAASGLGWDAVGSLNLKGRMAQELIQARARHEHPLIQQSGPGSDERFAEARTGWDGTMRVIA